MAKARIGSEQGDSPALPHSSQPLAERDQFAQWLNDFLGPEEQIIEGQNAQDLAFGLANQQIQRWQRLISIFDAQQLRNATGISSILVHVRHLITSNFPGPTVNQVKNSFVVTSKLPLIKTEPPNSKIELGLQFPLLAAAIIVRRCERRLLETGDEEAARLLIVAAIADSAVSLRADKELIEPIWETVDSYLSQSQDNISNLISDGTKLIEKMEQTHRASEESVARYGKELAVTDDLRERLFAEIRASEAVRLAAWKSQSTNALDSLREEVNAFAKMQASITLWRTKANWHTFNYILLGLLFGASLVTIAYLIVFGQISNFVAELIKIPSDHQFLGIALLAIPTLAVAWLLRFIARLAIQNLSLAHDARQRHAQVNTYLRLLGDANKPISEKERILALAALFRPLPGQGYDDVNPPTIADLLKEAQEQIPRPR